MAEDVPECKEVGGLVILMMETIRRPDGRLFYCGLHRDSSKTPRTKYNKPDLRTFPPPEQAASNVRNRTYNPDKQAYIESGAYTTIA